VAEYTTEGRSAAADSGSAASASSKRCFDAMNAPSAGRPSAEIWTKRRTPASTQARASCAMRYERPIAKQCTASAATYLSKHAFQSMSSKTCRPELERRHTRHRTMCAWTPNHRTVRTDAYAFREKAKDS
jgi:hypothetical protein